MGFFITVDDRVPERGKVMLESVEGIYRDGKVELLESVSSEAEGRVIVTFLGWADRIDL